MPRIFIIIIFAVAAIASSYAYLVRNNNLDTRQYNLSEVQRALESSITWVLNNQDLVIKDNNPALWWFLDESASLTGNTELASLVNKYRDTVLDRNSVWTGYFVDRPPYIYVTGSLNHIHNYQKFFIYGLSCDSDLGSEPFIQRQLDIGFCNWKPFYSSCSTHQLMGIRLLQIKQCGDQALHETLSNELADIIENQITWDPRVGDVYIQRVLTLVESGYAERVKPVWIKNILDEQRSDGGWANFYRLFNITQSLEFGFGYVFPDIRDNPIASFHTTAQAVYLLSLVHANQPLNNE